MSRINASRSTPASARDERTYEVEGRGGYDGDALYYRGSDRRKAEDEFDDRAYRNYEGRHDDDETVRFTVNGRLQRRFGPKDGRPNYFRPRGGVKRDVSHRRRSKTREEHIASLRYNIKDAREALKNAAGMSNWRAVKKYASELETLERKLFDAEGKLGGNRRRTREGSLPWHEASLSRGHRAGLRSTLT